MANHSQVKGDLLVKNANQAGWALSCTEAGDFVAVCSNDGRFYGEFSFDGIHIIASPKSEIGFFDLPLSIVQLIRYWFGTITFEEYERAIS